MLHLKPKFYIQIYCFNEWGDNVFPRPTCVITDEIYAGSAYDFSSLSLPMKQYWNEYNTFVLSQRGKLYMSCPSAIAEKITPEDCLSIQTLEVSLKENLEFPVISKLEDYHYPKSWFFDTLFHLNDTGKEARTQQLIVDMKKNIFSDTNY